MARTTSIKKSIRLGGLVAALAAILVSAGTLAACSRAQTTTSAPAITRTSAPAPTTTSAPTPTGVSAADFYKANVVTIVVPYSPGGGVDTSARLLADNWAKVIGGRMIVENRSGAGALAGTNYAYAARPDGLTMGIAIPGTGLVPAMLVQDPAAKFDIRKMNWVGYLNRETQSLGIGAKLPYESMTELAKATGLKFACVGRSERGTIAAALLIEFFGLQDARIVVGYGSSAEAMLSVAKGETTGHITADSTILDNMNKGFTKKATVTVGFDKSAYFPDTPLVPELVKLSPEQENLLRTLAALESGQVFWLPPGVPQDRIEFMRSAFDKIVASPAYLEQAKIRWPVWAKPVGGADFAARMDKSMSVATPQRFNE
ncbi:MAG: tripartite tricarboxylate transporter substrate-binding protein, partial [Dehalococcoidia bacterium]|nr:tripartite tricarboxylate transporter substrate-binding protein [Dehalococcoidia bacterium]